MQNVTQQDRFIPITEAFNRLCLKKTAGYGLVATGKLRIIKLGRKSVCAESELNTLVSSILESRSTSIVTEEQAALRAAAAVEAKTKAAAETKIKTKAVKPRPSKSQSARGA